MSQTVAIKVKARRHRWFERTLRPVFDPATGNERHERVCEICQMTRTTVIPPTKDPRDIWIEWESVNGKKSINGPTPECVGVNVVSVR